ncbi:MAG: DUF4355 domain-containing protein [Spirochaetales bacterium]|jgi:uncharacterized phage infection (PIP) family protein YhgE|nr:DUF4355 domain-containing protein [Spirochaetales bacterium]
MSEEKKFSQEELDAIVKERLERAEKKFAEKYAGYKSTEEVDKLTADFEKQISDLSNSISAEKEKYADFDKQLAEKDSKLKAYETSSIKTKVAHEVGLGFDAIGYLQGETEEEIKASAEGLKSLMGGSFVPPLANPEQPPESSTEGAMKELLRNMKGDN